MFLLQRRYRAEVVAVADFMADRDAHNSSSNVMAAMRGAPHDRSKLNTDPKRGGRCHISRHLTNIATMLRRAPSRTGS